MFLHVELVLACNRGSTSNFPEIGDTEFSLFAFNEEDLMNPAVFERFYFELLLIRSLLGHLSMVYPPCLFLSLWISVCYFTLEDLLVVP